MVNDSANSSQNIVQLLLLIAIQNILRVQNAWSIVSGKSLLRVLLESLKGEDGFNGFVEISVSNESAIILVSKEVLQSLVLFDGELNLLGVESGSELGSLDNSLSEWVVILQELAESDAISLNLVLHLLKESIVRVGTSKVDIGGTISRLHASVRLVDVVLQDKSVIDELQVLDITLLVAINADDGSQYFLRHLALEQVAGLSELLGRALQGVVAVLILEEASSIESFSLDELFESALEVINHLDIGFGGWNLSVDRGSSSITENDGVVFLKTLFSEDLINAVHELSPSDVVATSHVGVESIRQELELGSGKDKLAHVEANSKLSLSDVALSELIEVSEELTNSNSLLHAVSSDSSQHIVNVIRLGSADIIASGSWLSFRVVVERVVEVSADVEEGVGGVDVLAEVEVVHFVSVTLVHVSLKKDIDDVLRSRYLKNIKSSEELVFGHVLVLGDIEISQDGLQVNSLDSYGVSVLLEDAFQHALLIVGEVQILSSSRDSCIVSDWSNLGKRVLLNSVSGKSTVDAGAESLVVNKRLWVIRSIPGAEGSILLSSQIEVEHG